MLGTVTQDRGCMGSRDRGDRGWGSVPVNCACGVNNNSWQLAGDRMTGRQDQIPATLRGRSLEVLGQLIFRSISCQLQGLTRQDFGKANGFHLLLGYFCRAAGIMPYHGMLGVPKAKKHETQRDEKHGKPDLRGKYIGQSCAREAAEGGGVYSRAES
ncbi:hypothetical protein THAOC_22794 [Thalassiosira oceanica]|uniref:Uncharacterized protein n=1 Tax=Thalassiosira oceanica TaxID=159749 RepID=K0SF29_THAOC|nr:hypothetical protein THAOC_22794 [Thalassiosira oceanica]|eukprot:EJK57192.1 hypothetical protein THAOC_22794 [Thalassiosira oceanica]